MATNIDIQRYVQRRHGFVPTSGWIAHVKTLRGVPTRRRVEPCPPEKREAIDEALRHFGLLRKEP